MVKKFLNIFKRDKRVFSNEELKWQKKVGRRVKNTILAILILGEIIALFPMLDMLCKFGKRFFDETTTLTTLLIASYVGLIVVCIVIDSIFYVESVKVFRVEEIRFQLKSNLATEHKAEILSCLKGQEYSKVKFQENLINELCRMLLDSKFKIETTDKVTRISLPDSDVKPLEIKNENILKYFS